jgi:hypothetical protein
MLAPLMQLWDPFLQGLVHKTSKRVKNGSGQDAPASRCAIEHDRLVRRPQ